MQSSQPQNEIGSTPLSTNRNAAGQYQGYWADHSKQPYNPEMNLLQYPERQGIAKPLLHFSKEHSERLMRAVQQDKELNSTTKRFSQLTYALEGFKGGRCGQCGKMFKKRKTRLVHERTCDASQQSYVFLSHTPNGGALPTFFCYFGCDDCGWLYDDQWFPQVLEHYATHADHALKLIGLSSAKCKTLLEQHEGFVSTKKDVSDQKISISQGFKAVIDQPINANDSSSESDDDGDEVVSCSNICQSQPSSSSGVASSKEPSETSKIDANANQTQVFNNCLVFNSNQMTDAAIRQAVDSFVNLNPHGCRAHIVHGGVSKTVINLESQQHEPQEMADSKKRAANQKVMRQSRDRTAQSQKREDLKGQRQSPESDSSSESNSDHALFGQFQPQHLRKPLLTYLLKERKPVPFNGVNHKDPNCRFVWVKKSYKIDDLNQNAQELKHIWDNYMMLGTLLSEDLGKHLADVAALLPQSHQLWDEIVDDEHYLVHGFRLDSDMQPLKTLAAEKGRDFAHVAVRVIYHSFVTLKEFGPILTNTPISYIYGAPTPQGRMRVKILDWSGLKDIRNLYAGRLDCPKPLARAFESHAHTLYFYHSLLWLVADVCECAFMGKRFFEGMNMPSDLFQSVSDNDPRQAIFVTRCYLTDVEVDVKDATETPLHGTPCFEKELLHLRDCLYYFGNDHLQANSLLERFKMMTDRFILKKTHRGKGLVFRNEIHATANTSTLERPKIEDNESLNGELVLQKQN